MPILSRIQAFDARLRALSIPIDGVNGTPATNPAGPGTVAVQYQASATPEQIALGEAELAAFDWRPRRFLGRAAIATIIANLTTGQQNALLRRVAVDWIQEHESIVIAYLAEAGINVPYDEVVP
jgi:hypothetical protein